LPQEIKGTPMSAKPPICRSSSDAVNFWREQVAGQRGFKCKAENFWVITLDAERHLTGCHPVASKAFSAAARFADELFALGFLRGVEEIIIIHSRPRVALEASAEDKERIRAIILAGRSSKCELLDVIQIGEIDERHPLGFLSFYSRVRGFRLADPFAKSARKSNKAAAELEAAR
jgi:DNA repair protein RadC